MNIDPMMLFMSIVFSSIGIGYYTYGKKKGLFFRVTGLMLIFYPYFINSLLWLTLIGVALLFLPFVLERFISPP